MGIPRKTFSIFTAAGLLLQAAAPVMAQQSTNLNGCLPNPWPLPVEVAFAVRHLRPLAPGYEPNAPND